MADITMPQLGETVTEGTITRWLKKVGDRVEEDEILYEVSTDKVDSEVPSPTAGFLAEIVVQEGETVDVGAKLAVISDSAPSETAQQSVPEAEPAPEPEPQPEPEPEPEPAPAPEPEEQPAETPALAEETVAPDEQEGAADESVPDGGGKVLSPVVRRLIAENDLDPAKISGSGSGGRITRADVLALIDKGAKPEASQPAAPAPAAKEPAAPAPKPAAVVAPAAGGDEVVPFSNIRKRTAEHMMRSLSTSAHTLVAIEVDYENIERVRLPNKDRFRAEEGTGLSYLSFIARALVDAIREFPHVNASVGENELIVHRFVNLGVAVDLNYEGLIVPVVHDAQAKRLRALAREIADLASRARSKKLTADDIAGGTFTITNAGGYGTLLTGPIINQPQVAILSTDGVKPQPVAVPLPEGGYGIAVHAVGNLALSFDHRAYDGAYASAFLARIKEIMETRDWEAELA